MIFKAGISKDGLVEPGESKQMGLTLNEKMDILLLLVGGGFLLLLMSPAINWWRMRTRGQRSSVWPPKPATKKESPRNLPN